MISNSGVALRQGLGLGFGVWSRALCIRSYALLWKSTVSLERTPQLWWVCLEQEKASFQSVQNMFVCIQAGVSLGCHSGELAESLCIFDRIGQ